MGPDDQQVMSRPMSDYDYSPLKLALDKLTISDVWKNVRRPGIPKPSCRPPRGDDDRNLSLSISSDNHRWKDHDPDQDGEAADFCAAALGLSKEDVARKLIEMAGRAVTKPEQ
jgi:hypothetical protein